MGRKTQSTDLAELLQHSSWVKNLAYASLRDHALAEDVSQEVLLKALSGPRRSGGVLRAWLAAVTRNAARNEMRGVLRRQTREGKAARRMEVDAGPSDLVAAHRQITAAVDSLSAPSRQIILLHFYQEYSFKQIAVELDISINNAHVRLHRALKELRKVLQRQNGDWRGSCILMLPMGMQGLLKTSALHAANGGGVGGGVAGGIASRWYGPIAGALTLLAGILWIAVDWAPNPAQPEMEINAQPELATAESSPERFSKPEAPSDERAPSFVPLGEIKEPQPEMEACTGRVFYDGYPVGGAEIKAWQSGKIQSTQTRDDGFFTLDLQAESYAGITALFNGMAKWKGWDPDHHEPILIHLLPPPTEGVFAHVYDAETGNPIPGALLRVYADWCGDNYIGSVRANSLELIAEGITDFNGAVRIPDQYVGMRFATYAEAEGYHPNMTDDGSVELFPGQRLPVQLIYPDGKPVANLDVRLGYLVPQIDRTDENGFLPEVAEWDDTPEGMGIQSLPKCIFLHLPDGRVWYRQAYFDLACPDDVQMLADRIRIVVDTTPIQVELSQFALPEGSWVEAKCMGTFFPDLLPADPNDLWQRIEVGEIVELKAGWLVETPMVVSRIMPSGAHLGKHSVIDGKATIIGKVAHLKVTLQGRPVEEGRELVLGMSNNIAENQKLMIPMVNGVAEADVRQGSFLAWIEERANGETILLERRRGGFDKNFNLSVNESVVEKELQAFDQQSRTVLVRLDGVPVIKGYVNNREIGLDGVVQIPFDAKGQPVIQSVFLEVGGELHHENGGPILTRMNFPPGSMIPGRFTTSSSGQRIWNLQLASVILIAPSIPGDSTKRRLMIGKPHVSSRLQWPPSTKSSMLGVNLEIPAEGGWVQFRIPAGSYTFNIGRNVTFGGGEPVQVTSNTVTTLHPD